MGCGRSVRVLEFATEPDEFKPLLDRHDEPIEPLWTWANDKTLRIWRL